MRQGFREQHDRNKAIGQEPPPLFLVLYRVKLRFVQDYNENNTLQNQGGLS
jgi:hypothetical protein